MGCERLNACRIIYWFYIFVQGAEDNINDYCSKVDPEQVFEGIARLEVEERVLLNASHQEKCPDYSSIQNGQISNELPILFPQYGIGAEDIDQGCGGGDGMNQLEVDGPAPAKLIVVRVDLLLLVPKHEPVETDTDEVHQN